MIRLTSDQLIQAFTLNVRVIHMQLADLSDAEGLYQPPFRGNCANWVLGHVINTRDRILYLLGQLPVFGTNEQAIYATDSAAITRELPGVLPLHSLLRTLDQQQERIAAALGQVTPDIITQELRQGKTHTTVGEQIFGLYFHDTYHTGQFEQFRQLAGKNDKVL